MLSFVFGSLITFIQFLLLLYCATAWVKTKLHTHPWHVRTAAISISMFWLTGVLFLITIIPGIFNRWIMLACLFALAALSRFRYGLRPADVMQFYKDFFCAARHVWRQFPRWLKIMTLAIVPLVLIRLARGLIAPPLAWDALTYHLLKAGRWVQSGGWVFDNAPDCWQFYEWFPPLGDVYFAWAMLGTHTDAWLTWLGVAIWLNCVAGAYALARSLTLNILQSWVAAITVSSVPATISFISANYVDNTGLAIVTMGSALLITGTRSCSTRLLLTGTVAMALAVGIKITFLPYLLIGLVLLLWQFLSQKQWKLLSLAPLFIVPCLAWQGWLMLNGHTPFYPAPFSLAGIQIEPGQPEFIAHHYAPGVSLPYVYEMPISIKKFMWETVASAPGHYNFTWAFPALLFMGLLGTYQLCKGFTWRERIVYLGLFASGLVIFTSFWGPSTNSYRAIWADNMARFFSTWYVMLVVGGVALTGKKTVYLFPLLIIIHLFEAWPRQWMILDYTAVALGLGVLLGMLVGAYVIIRIRHLVPRQVLALTLFSAGLVSINLGRADMRYRFYDHGAVHDIYYPAGISGFSEAAKALDKLDGKSIVFTIAHEPIAYRWFRYVFLGSRLQNDVAYVSPTADGQTWSPLIDPDVPTMNFDKWKQRLKEQAVTHFVSVDPHPVETRFAFENFETDLLGPELSFVLLRIP